MVQEIITYLILLFTFGIVGLKLYGFIISAMTKKSEQENGKCGTCSTGCALKDLRGNPECLPNSTNTNIIL